MVRYKKKPGEYRKSLDSMTLHTIYIYILGIAQREIPKKLELGKGLTKKVEQHCEQFAWRHAMYALASFRYACLPHVLSL